MMEKQEILNTHFLNENSINTPNEDIFNFKYYANNVQKLIQQNANNKEPITFGIMGKWGEGKTSFLNLIKHKIEHFDKKEGDCEFLAYDFNPWRYSDQDEMLFDFFDGLSKRFYLNDTTDLQEIGLYISKYGKYLKAVKIASTIGMPVNTFLKKFSFDINEIFKALGEDLKQKNLTLEVLKNKVNAKLINAKFKVIVFIDDLDRLDKDEIYTILKLIKLNASFANFVFIVAIDSEHVSKAIGNRFSNYSNDITDGKLFLEKIINIPIQLPRIEIEDLQNFFEIKLREIINNLYFLDKNKKDNLFKDIRDEFTHVNYRSPREIIRVLNSFFISSISLQEEVDLKDLFWIEWLKVVNESLYSQIKNYQTEKGLGAFFVSQHEIINFNDEVHINGQDSSLANGTRKKMIERYPDYEWFLNKMFPIIVDHDQSKLFPYINLTEHFDKYFSYHLIGKISNIKIKKIEGLIKDKDIDGVNKMFVELYNSGIEENKIIFKLQEIIKNIKIEDGRDFFFNYIFDNLNFIKDSGQNMFDIDSKIRIIELTARTLDSDIENDNKKVAIELGEKLDVNELCYFTRKTKDDKLYKPHLEQLIVDKAKKQFSADLKPLYLDPKNPTNKMIMHNWKKYNSDEFNKYIINSLINLERVKILIRNFPGFWNNSFFGALGFREYDYMKSLINVDSLYNKIVEFNPELVDKIDKDYENFHESDESTIEQNLEQFIYLYKTKN